LSGQTPFPPGARIVVRETEWLVRSCTATERDGYKIRATGISELIRDEDAVFFTELEDPKPVLLKPEETILVPDDSAEFARGRLFLEATLSECLINDPMSRGCGAVLGWCRGGCAEMGGREPCVS
jgi:hypothetical protein